MLRYVVSNAQSIGGAEICSYKILNGHNCKLVNLTTIEGLEDIQGFNYENRYFSSFVRLNKAILVKLPSLLMFNFLNLIEILKRKKEYTEVEIIYINSISPLLFFLGFILPKTKKIYWVHDDYDNQSKLRKVIITLTSLLSSEIWFPCIYSKKSFTDNLFFFRKSILNKCSVVYNRFDNPNKDIHGISGKRKLVIGNVGRVEKNKNQLDFLKIQKSLSFHYDIEAVVVGEISDIRYKEKLDDFIAKNKLKVSFLVRESCDMPQIYEEMDLLIHTSKLECLPSVIIESFLNGTTAVSYNIGGVSEILTEEYLLCDDSLSKCVTKIIDVINSSERSLISEQKKIVDKFTF